MKSQLLEVLKIKPFLFLWLAEVFSQLAMNMANFILIIVAFKLANTNASVAGVVLSFTVPAILFGLLAGVYVDRWNKKNVLFITNVLRTGILVVLALFHQNLMLLYILSFVFSLITQFFIPAETPMVPQLVPHKYLLPANALFGMGIYGSVLIAYALSGPILILFGDTYVFLVLALFFLVASFFVLLIRLGKKDTVQTSKPSSSFSLTGEVGKAVGVVIKTREISHSLFLLAFSQILILILAVVGPGYASRVLGIPVDQLSLVLVTPSALGMVIGAVVIAHFFHNASKHKSSTYGLFLAGVSMLLLPYGSKVASKGFIHSINAYLPHFLTIDILHIMVFLAFLLGVANAMVFVPSNTILQEKTADEFRGKIYGALNSLIGIFSLIPIIVVGELADIFGVAQVITGIGVTIIVLGMFRFFFQIRVKVT